MTKLTNFFLYALCRFTDKLIKAIDIWASCEYNISCVAEFAATKKTYEKKVGVFEMKKLLAVLLALAMVLSFAACNQTGTPSESTPEESTSEPEQTDPATGATYKLGMGIVVSTDSSKTGTAQVDATVAAVVLDAEGKIVKADLDVAQTKMDITDGVVNTEIDARTKKEKGSDYGMVAYGAAIAEWDAQAAAFCDYIIGKTPAEVAAIETTVNEEGHSVASGANEDLFASCTMSISDFMAAFAKACNDEYAKEFTADEFTMGLTAITTADASCASATADAEGAANMYTEFAAVAVDKDGKVLADLVDTIQPKIAFSTTGDITTATFNGTKKELKDNYGMVAYGAAIAEWNVQATAFENYVVGKTATEINAIETMTNEEGHQVATGADADLFASCTMSVSGYMASVTKAIGVAK